MGKRVDYLTEQDMECVKAYADNNMCEQDTANQLYVCRNTVVYHLGRVKRITGLNPRNFYDLAKLVGANTTVNQYGENCTHITNCGTMTLNL